MLTAEHIKYLDELHMKAVVADRYHRMNIGMRIFSRDKSVKGVVTGVSARYCAACERCHPCYLVTWENGKKTKPCTKSVGETIGGLQLR